MSLNSFLNGYNIWTKPIQQHYNYFKQVIKLNQNDVGSQFIQHMATIQINIENFDGQINLNKL